MNPVYQDILLKVRAALPDLPKGQRSRAESLHTDFTLLRGIFWSLRGVHDPKGMRLTNLGHSILKGLYRVHDIDLQGRHPTARDLIYLDMRSKFPYYVGSTTLFLYDSDLALKLMFADGDLAILADIDPGSR